MARQFIEDALDAIRPIIFRFDDSSFKVTPEELARQAANVESGVSAISARFAGAEQSVKNTLNYWNGEASDLFRTECEGYRDEIEEILARITEHVTDLRTMAGVYEEAEASVQEIIEALPSDVII